MCGHCQVRHGAAIGLRELLSSQATSAAVSVPLAELPSGELASEYLSILVAHSPLKASLVHYSQLLPKRFRAVCLQPNQRKLVEEGHIGVSSISRLLCLANGSMLHCNHLPEGSPGQDACLLRVFRCNLVCICAGWLVSNGRGKPAMALLNADQVHAAMASHDACLSNCVEHLIQLLARDRFADFGSDQVSHTQHFMATGCLMSFLHILKALEVTSHQDSCSAVSQALGPQDSMLDWYSCPDELRLQAALLLNPSMLQAVAPVRETAAQALGASATAMSAAGLHLLAHLLRQLCESSEWTVRQSGLLGLKYLLASTPAASVLAAVTPVLTQSLQVCCTGLALRIAFHCITWTCNVKIASGEWLGCCICSGCQAPTFKAALHSYPIPEQQSACKLQLDLHLFLPVLKAHFVH